jgi:pyruvate/2-oxoglutarate/acetoin dehydrogenase E1 component
VSRTLTYAEAIREATDQEMARDPAVFVYGLGVDDPKATLGTTRLVDKYGPSRVWDTPLSEDAMTGFGVGAALAGMRPIHVHIRMDFLMLAMNQLVNLAAKYRYSYGGAAGVPLVVRAMIGKSWGQGPQHSQGLHAMFMHVPGLRVVAPSTPYDAKGMLAAAVRLDDPVLYVEHRMLYGVRGEVPEEPYALPLGRARVLAKGEDVTLVGVSYYAVECLRARALLAEAGVDAEVIDPVSLSPLDVETLAASARRTGRLLVVDSGWTGCGASAEIVARVVEETQCDRQVHVGRMGFAATVCPTAPTLEEHFYPNAGTIAEAAYRLVRPNAPAWSPDAQRAPELVEFRGPF